MMKMEVKPVQPEQLRTTVSPPLDTPMPGDDMLAVDVTIRVVHKTYKPVTVSPEDTPYDREKLSEYVGMRTRKGILREFDTAFTEFVQGHWPYV